MGFAELPRAIQIQLAAIGPLLFGLVCGFVLALDAATYWALSALSALGGLAGGAEHASHRASLVRGTIGGACFGLGTVVANAASVGPALAPLPSPTAALILVTAIAGAGLAALGTGLRSRLWPRLAIPAQRPEPSVEEERLARDPVGSG